MVLKTIPKSAGEEESVIYRKLVEVVIVKL